MKLFFTWRAKMYRFGSIFLMICVSRATLNGNGVTRSSSKPGYWKISINVDWSWSDTTPVFAYDTICIDDIFSLNIKWITFGLTVAVIWSWKVDLIARRPANCCTCCLDCPSLNEENQYQGILEK